MRPAILITLICLSIATATTAQQRERVTAQMNPLVLVDNVETDIKYLLVNPANIERIEVLKDSAGIQAYGEKGRQGVVLITLKPHITLNRLSTILDQFNIAAANRNLKVCIDKVLVKDVSKILIDSREVQNVEITTDRIMNYPVEEYTGEKYINIISRKEKTVVR